MLKIITSVVLSLVTIMAVTLFAVTVPAQSQKIEDNAAAIVKAQTDAETNAYNKVKEDILSDMSGSTLEDVGTAISALQDKELFLHYIKLKVSNVSATIGGSSKTVYLETDLFPVLNNSVTALTSSTLAEYFKNNISQSGEGSPIGAYGSIKSGSDLYAIITNAFIYISTPYPGASPSITLRFFYYDIINNAYNIYSSGVTFTLQDNVIKLI